jgi:ACS family D-galactonate transporter-like MFS transporter
VRPGRARLHLIGVVAGGLLSDWLLRRGASVATARKTPIMTGLLLVPTMTLAVVTDTNWIVIAIMSFAFFAQGVASASASWSLVADIAPEGMVGITGGAVDFAGNLSGIVPPIAIGFIVRATGSFGWALGLISLFAIVAVLCYTFLPGDVKRIEIDDDARGGRDDAGTIEHAAACDSTNETRV